MKNVKNTVLCPYVIIDLSGEEIFGEFLLRVFIAKNK